MKRLLLLAGLLAVFAANAGISFAELAQLTSTPNEHSGRFNQEKYLKSVDASLRSNGVFAYQRGKSIRWETLQPIRSELLMTPQGISQLGNGELLQLEAGANPTSAVLGEIFFAVLTSDWESLATYFTLSGSVDENRWQVVLVPQDTVLRQVFTQVELRGSRLLEEIVLHEAGGNRTTIQLD